MTKAARDLRTITHEAFEPYVGQTFEVSAEENGPSKTQFILASVSQKGTLPEPFRQPFSLIFHGAPDLPLGQQSVWLSHPEFGSVSLFIVPVAGDAEKRQYQAVFC